MRNLTRFTCIFLWRHQHAATRAIYIRFQLLYSKGVANGNVYVVLWTPLPPFPSDIWSWCLLFLFAVCFVWRFFFANFRGTHMLCCRRRLIIGEYDHRTGKVVFNKRMISRCAASRRLNCSVGELKTTLLANIADNTFTVNGGITCCVCGSILLRNWSYLLGYVKTDVSIKLWVILAFD